MTNWIAWSMLVSALVAMAAAAASRVAAHFRLPRRFIWIVAMGGVSVASLVMALRPAPPVVYSPTIHVTSAVPTIAGPAAKSAAVPITHVAPWPAVARVADEWIVRGWVVASLVWSTSLALVLLRQRRRRAQWSDADLGTCRVLVAPDAGPAVVGVLRPRIVIPSWVLDAERSTQELLLRHELEHVRAGDTRVLFAAAVLTIVFPWNAALWWMARQLRLAIEIDCDARVIGAVGGAHAYGLVLLAVGERLGTSMSMSPGLSEPQTNLEARINAMTTPATRRPFAASLPFAVIALVVLTTAAWAPRPQPLVRSRIAAPLPKPAAVSVVRQSPVTQPVAKTPAVASPASVAPRAKPIAAFKTPRLDSPAAVDPKPLYGIPTPRYPDSLKAEGTEGHVALRFVADANGVPDTTTIQLIESTHPGFTDAVRRVVPRWRFDGGGVVRMACRFRTWDTEAKEKAGQAAPVFVIDGAIVDPIIITAATPLSPNQASVPTPPRP